MKKMFSIIISLLLLSFFAACGGGDKADKSAKRKARAPKAKAGYQTMAVTDGGAITGKATFTGTIPPKKKLEVTKDVNVCGKVAHKDESIVASSDNGLANVVVKITNISKGKGMDSMGAEFSVDQNGCMFIPHVILVPAGAELTIMNSDGVLHNIHTYSEKNDVMNVAQPGFKKKMIKVFEEEEIFRVACDVHNWMGGYFAIAGHPYHAVTGADGSFTLTDVPAGTYTLEFWQEKLGTQTVEVTVAAGGSAEANATFAIGG